MSERHDHEKNFSGKIRIQSFTKAFILQVYDVFGRFDVLARHAKVEEIHGMLPKNPQCGEERSSESGSRADADSDGLAVSN
jgi:hypothetical protein